MFGIVYLIQPEEYLGTATYKIGMSASNTSKRIDSYGKQSRVLSIVQCKDPSAIEEKIIHTFTEKFNVERGREYFSGDEEQLMTEFHQCIGTSAFVEPEESSMNAERQERIIELLNGQKICQKLYHLLALLPATWFQSHNNVKQLIFSMRNSNIYKEDLWLPTIKKLLFERYDKYQYEDIVNLSMIQMNARQAKLTLCAIQKYIRSLDENGYRAWHLKYNQTSSRIVFSDENAIPLSFAQDILTKDKLTPAKLSKVHRDIVIKKCNACKSCNKIANKNCCSEYSVSNRSMRMFIMNANIV